MRATTLTREQQFARDGFFIQRESILGPELLDRAVQGLLNVRDGVYDTGVAPDGRNWNPGEPKTLVKLDAAHLASTGMFDALVESQLGELAAEITGAEWVQVWALQGLYKPPTPGMTTNATNVGWHQDQTLWSPWWQEGSVLFTAWLALSDVTAASGPMQFVAGSHTWGEVGGSFFEQDQAANRSSMKTPPGAEWTEVPVILPPGGVSFHQSRLIHGSHQNVSSSPRMSMAIHLRTDKSKLSGNDPYHLSTLLEQPDVSPVIFCRH